VEEPTVIADNSADPAAFLIGIREAERIDAVTHILFGCKGVLGEQDR
jgi:hypothetical protein